MPRGRTSMRKIREVLRQSWVLGLSHRQVERSVRVAHGTVVNYLRRATVAGLTWEEVEGLDDGELERRLFPSSCGAPVRGKPEPEWRGIQKELKRKGVTLSLLWQEYREGEPEGYGYSRFCQLFRAWQGRVDVALRQDYRAGEKLLVDYAGQTVPIVDRETGEVEEAQIFVAVLGASSYTYAEATASQTLADWIGSHVQCLEFLGGVPELVVPDNLKSAVSKPCRYDPEINRTYADLAEHYGVAVVPARAGKPRDKAKAESGVLQVTRWILARLRDETFFSLRQLNTRIAELLVELNDRPLKGLGQSRRELYEQLDRPALKPLPASRYVLAEWKKVRVGPDYHVELAGHYYSVPYQLVRQQLDLRACSATVEVFHRGKRVAAHARTGRRGRHTTVAAHMPKAHQAYLDWTPKRLVDWGRKTGRSTAAVVEAILVSRPHPQQGFRACLGLLRLGERYGAERLEAACRRAQAIGSCSYQSVKSILQAGLDRQPLAEPAPELAPVAHRNVRGAEYYQDTGDAEEGQPC